MKRIGIVVLAVIVGLMCWADLAQAWEWLPLDTREAAIRGATHVARFTYKDFTNSVSTGDQVFSVSVPAKWAIEMSQMQLVTAFNTAHAYYTNSVTLKIGDGSDDDLFLTSTELASDGTEVFVKYGPPFSSTITSTPTKQTAAFVTGATGQTAAFATGATGQTAAFVTGATGQTGSALTSAGVTDETGSVISGVTLQTATLTYLNASTQAVTALVVTNVVLTTANAVTNTALAYSNINVWTNATLATASAWTNATLATASAWTNATLATANALTNVTVASTATAGELGRKLYATAGYLVFDFTAGFEALDDNTAGELRAYFRIFDSTQW